MGTKQLLIILFLAGSQVVVAGNGMPVKSQSAMDVKSRWKSRKSVDFNFKIDEISIKTDFTGSKSQERYYMKNRLNVLKKPLYAFNPNLFHSAYIRKSKTILNWPQRQYSI